MFLISDIVFVKSRMAEQTVNAITDSIYVNYGFGQTITSGQFGEKWLG